MWNSNKVSTYVQIWHTLLCEESEGYEGIQTGTALAEKNEDPTIHHFQEESEEGRGGHTDKHESVLSSQNTCWLPKPITQADSGSPRLITQADYRS